MVQPAQRVTSLEPDFVLLFSQLKIEVHFAHFGFSTCFFSFTIELAFFSTEHTQIKSFVVTNAKLEKQVILKACILKMYS